MRMQEEIADIASIMKESLNYVVTHLSSIDRASIRRFEMPPEQEIKYGLRKYIIAATGYNTILGIDTKFNTILWKYLPSYLE